MSNRLRIIGGQWRSRIIGFPDIPGLRPTPNRVRETAFNWLQFDLADAVCLDLFAGSGALGLEALSRGAAHATLVESHPAACLALRDNARKLGAVANVVQSDVMRYLAGTPQAFHVAFLDPPFGQGLVAECCRLLETRGWLGPAALIYIEAERQLDLSALPSGWQLLRSKTAGEVGYHLYLRQPPAGAPTPESAAT
ncbi:MAG: 16S rRNA (guanine(966)-N(2))-methyltransferase RsmD [Methylococcaceae bacterium]|nr:MAG: 16S rRNA (guanine(966)-N(2))-methyltransferase RsmD [Methylococcaceae bacterium]